MSVHIDKVPRHLGLDILGSIGVFERILGVFEMIRCRRYAYDHDCPTVSAKGESKKSSELAVSIGDMADTTPGFAKGVDAIPESKEGLVNISSFYHSLTHVGGGARAFAARKIDYGEGSHGIDFVGPGSSRSLSDVDLKNGMRPGGRLVGKSRGLGSSSVALHDHRLDLLRVFRMLLRQAWDGDTSILVLAHGQSSSGNVGISFQQ